MNAIELLENHLQTQNPSLDWSCRATAFTDSGNPNRVEISAMHDGRRLSERPLSISVDLISRLGVEAAAWLVSNEFSAARAGVDWDKLAEV